MTTMRKQKTPGSYSKYVYCVNQFAFSWYFFHDCSFYSFVTIIFAKIWNYANLNGDVKSRRILSQVGEYLCPMALHAKFQTISRL